MTRNLLAASLLSLTLIAPTAATAGLVTWELEGTIELASPYTVPHGFFHLHADELIPQLEDAGLVPGASWRARISFDSETTADCTDCDGGFAGFVGATKSIEFLAGTFSATSPSGGVGNAGLGSDMYFQSEVGNDSTTLFAVSAVAIFTSLDGETLFATSLPTDPPDLSDLLEPVYLANGLFYGTRFNVRGYGFVRNTDMAIALGHAPLVSQSFGIDARITSITPVPEPSLLALLLALAPLLALRLARTRAPPALLAIAVGWSGGASAGSVSGELERPINQVAPYQIAIPNPGTPTRPNADEVVVLLEAVGVSSGPAWNGRLAFDWAPPVCDACTEDALPPGAAKSIEFPVGAFAAVASADGVVFRVPVSTDSEHEGGGSSSSLPIGPPNLVLSLLAFVLVAAGTALALRRR